MEFLCWVGSGSQKDDHKVQHLQADILDVLGGLEKAFVLGDYPYCNIRRAGPGQDALKIRELLEDDCA